MSRNVPVRRPVRTDDVMPWALAVMLWLVALALCPTVPRVVLQATRLGLLYVFARG